MLADFHGAALGASLVFLLLLIAVGIAVLVLSILVTVRAYQDGRKGWWIYLIAVFVSPFNLVAVVAWYAYLRDNPVRDGQGRKFL